MNVLAPISDLMTTDLITANPSDKLSDIKEIFEKRNIRHLPIVRFRKMVGLISKTDMLPYMGKKKENVDDRFVNEARLRAYTAEDIMVTGLATLEPHERINVALDLFLLNRFHAIPVVKDDELIGLLTTFDIIKALAEEPITADQITAANKARSEKKG